MGYWPSLTCLVKIAGYWPFFAKRTWPISGHLDRTSLVNKRICDLELRIFFLAGQFVTPSGQSRAPSCLHAQVANHNTGFGWSCPLMELQPSNNVCYWPLPPLPPHSKGWGVVILGELLSGGGGVGDSGYEKFWDVHGLFAVISGLG